MSEILRKSILRKSLLLGLITGGLIAWPVAGGEVANAKRAAHKAAVGTAALRLYGMQDPSDAARSIATGMSCELGWVDPHTWPTVGEYANAWLPVSLSLTESLASQAAKEQYDDTDGSPLGWNDQPNLDLFAFKGTGDDLSHPKILSSVGMAGPDSADNVPDVVGPPDVLDGTVVGIYDEQVTWTGSEARHNLNMTIYKRPCGAVEKQNGAWYIVADAALPIIDSTFTTEEAADNFYPQTIGP